MIAPIDETHDPALESWVESANHPETDFPIQNLPFGRFRGSPVDKDWRIGVAIGESILDLQSIGLAEIKESSDVLHLSSGERRTLRRLLSRGLRRGSADESLWRSSLVDQSSVCLGVPCDIRGYTDFYTGIHHAMAVGQLFRPDNPLLPNYKWVPIGYHGRTSSIVASGHDIVRPLGQIKGLDSQPPTLAPTARLDYELELGIIVGQGNVLGEPVSMAEAESHIAGLTLLNDWSARDVQTWEYQPLGPFLAKNFATTVSPWIVTLDALAPYRQPFTRPARDPQPLPYLDSAENSAMGAMQIDLEVFLRTAQMRRLGSDAERLSRSNYLHAYWTAAQLVAHHTVNGCSLETGDLLGTGTLSGPDAGEGGSLLELSAGGKVPLSLANGERRTFLQDGDTVTFRAFCAREGFRRIGFGGCAGTIVPARVSHAGGAPGSVG